MTAAIFGLVGVVVGGVLTGLMNWWLQGKQTKAATRAIARLTYDDFLHYQSMLVRALAGPSWWDAGSATEAQVSVEDRKLLLGQLGDEASQDVAAAQGWVTYLMRRREHAASGPPAEHDLRAMRDTFCRLDQARWQLSGSVSGRKFGSFQDGGVLANLEQPRTLDELGISDETCRARRAHGYGREPERPEIPGL